MKRNNTAKPDRTANLSMVKSFLREHRAALLVLVLLLLARLITLYELRYDYTLSSDDLSYVNSGITFAKTGAITMHENLLDDGTPVYSAQIMPGMTILIGLVCKITGEGLALWKVLKLLWVLMGVGTAWFVYRTVRLFAPMWCGVLSMLWFFRTDYVWMDNLILTETPFLLCLSAMVYCTFRMGREETWKPFWGTLAWWLLGLSLKANIALYPLFALAYLLLLGYDRKLLGRQCIAVACVTACFLVPWTVRNYIRFHAFIPLTYGAGNPTLEGTYQKKSYQKGPTKGILYPTDEELDYETNVDAVVRERYAEFYQEDGTVKPEYWRYISLRTDAVKAAYRQRIWWEKDWKSMAYSYLIDKPRRMIFSTYHWERVFDVEITTTRDFQRLDFALCTLAVAASLILKKRRLPVLFLTGTYLGNIYIYAMTYAFDRYGASLLCLRLVLTGLGVSLGIQLLERGVAEIHRFERLETGGAVESGGAVEKAPGKAPEQTRPEKRKKRSRQKR